MPRWTCTKCGSTKLAPTRPRRDDVRRYCLSCSESTGRLVERVAPALERKREAGRLKSAERAKSKKQTKRESETFNGVHIPSEARRLWKLFGKRSSLPEITVRQRRNGDYVSGHAYPWEKRITITVGTDPIDTWGVLAHELCHVAVGSSRTATGSRSWHGEDFYRALVDVTLRRFKLDKLPTLGSLSDLTGYKVDGAIRAGLRDAGVDPTK